VGTDFKWIFVIWVAADGCSRAKIPTRHFISTPNHRHGYFGSLFILYFEMVGVFFIVPQFVASPRHASLIGPCKTI